MTIGIDTTLSIIISYVKNEKFDDFFFKYLPSNFSKKKYRTNFETANNVILNYKGQNGKDFLQFLELCNLFSQF